MTLCLLCARRRASRDCPALNAGICPPCCGTKRRRTVNCPDDCTYLTTGRKYQAQRELETEILDEARQLSPDLLHNLEYAMLTVRDTRFRDLKDREVKEALENVKKTIETAERKIIYAYRSVDPRIQIVADSVFQVIERHRKGEDELRKVETEEVKVMLTAILAALRETVTRNQDSSTYLELITQYSLGRLVKADEGRAPAKPEPEGLDLPDEPGSTGLIRLS